MAPRHLGFMIILFVIILVFFEFGSEVISEVVGFIYPAYMSFKAIESEKKDDDK
jgi:receptor expression-enhancing protein 5/6